MYYEFAPYLFFAQACWGFELQKVSEKWDENQDRTKILISNLVKLDYIIQYKVLWTFQFKRGQIAEFIDAHRLIFNGLLKQNLFFDWSKFLQVSSKKTKN